MSSLKVGSSRHFSFPVRLRWQRNVDPAAPQIRESEGRNFKLPVNFDSGVAEDVPEKGPGTGQLPEGGPADDVSGPGER